MSFGADEEILQDFLVEAGEILEQLSEQLVELESRPDDTKRCVPVFPRLTASRCRLSVHRKSDSF